MARSRSPIARRTAPGPVPKEDKRRRRRAKVSLGLGGEAEALVLDRYQVRAQQTHEMRAAVAAARLDPKHVRVQLVVGSPGERRPGRWAFMIDEDETVLGTFQTTHQTTLGPQRVFVGFIVPRSMLPHVVLDDAAQERIASALADALIRDLERPEQPEGRLGQGVRRGR